MFVILETTTAALGTLAPGNYTLTTTSWGVPVASNTFIVPTNSPPPGWQPVTWEGTVSLVTTGNVTYVEYTWGRSGCEDVISIGPVIRNGSNFWYDFEIEFETGVPCPMFVILETTTAALGTLAPGNYTLTTTSWGVPVASNTFTVPTNSTPTLRPIGFGAERSFNIQLTGVTNVNYVLQRSTNFVNWTSLSTNSAGPPLRDPSPVVPGPCYYRVQILDTTTILGN
jgi:uncharacterized protein YaiE (UPF0345 family)